MNQPYQIAVDLTDGVGVVVTDPYAVAQAWSRIPLS